MNSSQVEQQIQTEVDELRIRFSDTQELYREVCALLFFRYGITPTANMLYQYVKKGSMSAPAAALKKFWIELREKSRLRIEQPDLPDNLKNTLSDFAFGFWNAAQKAAAQVYESATGEWQTKINLAYDKISESAEQIELLQTDLTNTKISLDKALHDLHEAEKQHAVDIEVSVTLENSLKSLQIERDELKQDQERCRRDLSRDIQLLNEALAKAEERYGALEARSLLEIDRERQRLSKAEKEISTLRQQQRSEHQRHQKEVSKLQVAALRSSELIGKLRGQLSLMSNHNKQLLKENKGLLNRK